MIAINKQLLVYALGAALGATQDGHTMSDEEAMRRMQRKPSGRHSKPKQSKQSKKQAKASRRKNRGK